LHILSAAAKKHLGGIVDDIAPAHFSAHATQPRATS
jgi:hypothetical protein